MVLTECVLDGRCRASEIKVAPRGELLGEKPIAKSAAAVQPIIIIEHRRRSGRARRQGVANSRQRKDKDDCDSGAWESFHVCLLSTRRRPQAPRLFATKAASAKPSSTRTQDAGSGIGAPSATPVISNCRFCSPKLLHDDPSAEVRAGIEDDPSASQLRELLPERLSTKKYSLPVCSKIGDPL